MISLLSTILGLSYESKIHMPQYIIGIITTALILSSAAVAYLTVAGLCNAAIALLDLSSAITIILLLLRKS